MTTPVLHLAKSEGMGAGDGDDRNEGGPNERVRDENVRNGSVRDEIRCPDLPRETTMKYCLHCGWQVRAADGHTRRDRSAAAVAHFVATGHTVDSL